MKKLTKINKICGMNVPEESIDKLKMEENHHRKHVKVIDRHKKQGKEKIARREERRNY